MANRVSNLLTLSSDATELNERKAKVVDVNKLALMLAVLTLLDKDSVNLYTSSDYKTIAEVVEEWLFKKQLADKVLAIASLRASYPKLLLSKADLEMILYRPEVGMKEVDWYDNLVWANIPIGCYVITMLSSEGFSGLMKKVHGISMNPLVLNLYEWKTQYLGSKTGVYDLVVDENRVHFCTAWSPLNENALLSFIMLVEKNAVARFEKFVYRDMRAGFWGEAKMKFGVAGEQNLRLYHHRDTSIAFLPGTI